MSLSFDANILVYAVSEDSGPKMEQALGLLERAKFVEGAVLLLQSLTEFSHVTLRKLRHSPARVEGIVSGWRSLLPVHAAAPDDLPAALDAVATHNLSFWDAMLWATARRVGVRHLLTEDFQDGRTLGGVTFLNPFEPSNRARLEKVLAPSR